MFLSLNVEIQISFRFFGLGMAFQAHVLEPIISPFPAIAHRVSTTFKLCRSMVITQLSLASGVDSPFGVHNGLGWPTLTLRRWWDDLDLSISNCRYGSLLRTSLRATIMDVHNGAQAVISADDI